MRNAVFFGVLLVVALGARAGEQEAGGKVYEVQVDGKVFDVQAGQEKVLKLADGRTVRIRVREKPVQTYRTDTLVFQYDNSVSIRDDKAKQERQILMMHASGRAVIVGDIGPAKDHDQAQLLTNMMAEVEARARRGVANDLKREPKKAVKFPGAAGHFATISYLDEDNDRMVFRVYVLQSGRRVFSVARVNDKENEKDAEKLAKLVLESIRARK
jgi:hypothetical protein